MGLFFQEREGLGKAHAEKGSKGGRHVASVGSMQGNAWKTYGDPPPALHYCSRRALPTEFFVLEKRDPWPTAAV